MYLNIILNVSKTVCVAENADEVKTVLYERKSTKQASKMVRTWARPKYSKES